MAQSGRARILAKTRSYRPFRTTGSRQPSASSARNSPRSPFITPFSAATRTDQGSISVASTFRCSSFAAAMPRMPEPVPRSRMRRGFRWATASKASRQPRVDSCSPEPKASPASSRSTSRSHSRGLGRCVGRIVKRRPRSCSGKASTVRASQPSASVGWRSGTPASKPETAAARASAALSAASSPFCSQTPSSRQVSSSGGSRK